MSRGVKLVLMCVGLLVVSLGVSKLRKGAEARRQERLAQLDVRNRENDRRERERNRQDVAALLADPAPPTAEEVAAFRPVFDRLGKALADGDADACTAAFDLDRLAQELGSLGMFERLPGGNVASNRAAFMRGGKEGLGKGLVGNEALRWDRTDVRRVRRSADGREAVVIAFHRSPLLENRAYKIRWWLVETPGGWKVFDLEELDMGMRVSRVMNAATSPQVLREVGNDPARLRLAVVGIREAASALVVRHDAHGAEKHLEAARRVALPPPIAAVREMIEGLILLENGAPEAALKRFDEADRLQPDIPALHAGRASVAVAASRFGEALQSIRKYLAEVGPDPDALAIEGLALEGLERHPEAAASYRKALDELPEQDFALSGLRRVMGDADRAELALRVAKTPDPLRAFDELFQEAEADKDKATLAALNKWLRTAYPDDHRAIRGQFRELIDAEKFDEAAAALRTRLGGPGSGEVKSRALTIYLYAMAEVGRAPQAYAAVPDSHAATAFRVLADNLDEQLTDEPPDEIESVKQSLRDLLAARRKKSPDDAMLWYYEGSLLRVAKKYAEAERTFAEGQAKLPKLVGPTLPDDETDWDADRFRSARVDCFYQMKQGLKAYAEVGPADETFQQLAYSYDADKDADGLAALVAAHQKKSPDDKRCQYWSAETLRLRGKHADAAAGFRAYLKATGEDAPYRWMAIDRGVRGYLRESQPEKARDAIAEIGRERVPAGLRAAVALAAGQPGQAEEILAELAGKPGGYGHMYYDEDFARLIKQPEYANLRKKYPDPRDVKAAGVIG